MREKLEKVLRRELLRYKEFSSHRFLEGIVPLTFFVKSLLEWNKKVNLVGKKDPLVLFHELLIDSLFMVKFLEEACPIEDAFFLDIGAGAGIPGIGFRIYVKKGRYVMLEPRKKRYVFINLMVRSLCLRDTQVFPYFFEEVKGKFSPSVVLARAVWKWRDFLTTVSPILSPGGLVLVFSNKECPYTIWEEYVLLSQYRYSSYHGNIRYFWLFEKRAPS